MGHAGQYWLNYNRKYTRYRIRRSSEFHLRTDWYDCSIRKKHRSEGNGEEKQEQVPRIRNTENVAYENRGDPCGCWCAWYSKEEDRGRHKEVSEAHGICAILKKVLGVWTEWLTWETDALGAWFAPGWCSKNKTPVKTAMEEIITMITHKRDCDGIYEPHRVWSSENPFDYLWPDSCALYLTVFAFLLLKD